MSVKEIKSRILKSKPVEWKKFEFLQTESFKELSKEAYQKIKESILRNGFAESFKVWQNGRKLYCLDGYHRCKVLSDLEREGVRVPAKFHADFLACKNQKEAAKLVLIYSSIYAHITDEGLYEFQHTFDLNFEEIKFEIDLPDFDLDKFAEGWLNDEQNEADAKRSIKERFIVPPFSVLDTRQGYWQERAKAWNTLIDDFGESRENALYKRRDVNAETHLKITAISTSSVLDAVLAELAVKWFCPAGGTTFDPFAGDTVFGFVSAYSGFPFTGIELRPEQARTNQQRVNKHKLAAKYICDDGRNVLKHIKPGSRDFLFSCPPYFNLERYSDLANDASNQKSYEDFLALLEAVFAASVKALKNNRFAVIVVGDIRDEKGNYRGFPSDVVEMFERNGMWLYNDIVLLNVAGKAGMKVDGQFTTYRKVVKVHQNVLVFYKGNAKTIKENFGAIDLAGDEEPIQQFLTKAA